MAKEKGVAVGDVTVIMLDRAAPRRVHDARSARWARRIRLIPHGDVSAALAAVTEDSAVDLLFGIGGTPEGVLAAAAIQCTGGQILGRLWPRNDEERNAALEAGYDLDEVLDKDRLVSGNDVFFAATGVTDGELLDGVHYIGPEGATTESLVDALALRHRAPHQRAARPREAARDHRRAAGVIAGLRDGAERADARGLELEVGERAQERVGHDHVDPQLGLLVEPAADAGRRSRGRSSRPPRRRRRSTSPAPSSTGLRWTLRRRKPRPRPAPRDQHAAVDRPGDRAAVAVEVVLRLVEAQ